MSGQIDSRKRPIQQMSAYVDVPAGDLGQNFKSKADFVNYWSTCLQWYTPPLSYMTKVSIVRTCDF